MTLSVRRHAMGPCVLVLVALGFVGGCVDSKDRCGANARLKKLTLSEVCQSFAELDGGLNKPDAAVAGPADAAPRPDGVLPHDGGSGDASPPDALRKGTWGDPCTTDAECGGPEEATPTNPMALTTNRCGIQTGGRPFPGEMTGACTREGCTLNDATTCPGDWTCIAPKELGFPGFPIACWCLLNGGTRSCHK